MYKNKTNVHFTVQTNTFHSPTPQAVVPFVCFMGNNFNDFWREVKTINNGRMPLPSTIEGVVRNDTIVELRRKHYHDLFNCVSSNMYNVTNCQFSEDMVVRSWEVREASQMLEESCGPDLIFADHLKYG